MSLTTHQRKNILEALELGMPMSSAADYVELDMPEIDAEMRRDVAFRRQVRKAIAECMYSRLQKLDQLKNWQALAFILESIWPSRWGRHSKGRKRPRSLRVRIERADFSKLTVRQQRIFQLMLDTVYGRRPALPSPRRAALPDLRDRRGR